MTLVVPVYMDVCIHWLFLTTNALSIVLLHEWLNVEHVVVYLCLFLHLLQVPCCVRVHADVTRLGNIYPNRLTMFRSCAACSGGLPQQWCVWRCVCALWASNCIWLKFFLLNHREIASCHVGTPAARSAFRWAVSASHALSGPGHSELSCGVGVGSGCLKSRCCWPCLPLQAVAAAGTAKLFRDCVNGAALR